ncbi:hypothetical protein ABBQ38_008399 [Trebouxia sp. C0009 RCD-2024]
MPHDIQETVLGKRKRREASAVADKPQARIDHYFTSKDPVKKASNGHGHSTVSDHKVHMLQVRCDSAAASQVGVGADAGQAQCSMHRQLSQQAAGSLNLRDCDEQADCAADDHVAEARPSVAVQGEQPQTAKAAQAAASKLDSKQAGPNMLQLPHATTEPTSAPMTQPDLAEHLSFFLSVLPERQHFRELDVTTRVAPQALVGRKLRVYWPDDDGWYLGTVAHFDPRTAQHKVAYDDGDKDELHLAMERVRLLMHAGETFVPPQAADLELVAKGLLTAANNRSALSPRTRARSLSPSQELLLQEAEAEAGALRKRGLQLERHAQQLRSASRGMTASQVSVTHGAEEVALPQQPTGQPKETQQRLERLPSQQDASLDEAQQQLQEVASAAAVQQAEASVVTPSAQQFAASVPPQAGPQQQEDEQAALATAESAAAAAAAVATRVEVAQGVVAQHEAHAQGSTLQGMVVWGNFKGWPAWPGLVTTEEEMDVAEVKGRKGQLLQVPGRAPGKVPVHFFGTQEFAWMRRSDVVAFGAGLEAGMHLCKASNRAKAAFRKALHEVSVYFLVSLPAKHWYQSPEAQLL